MRRNPTPPVLPWDIAAMLTLLYEPWSNKFKKNLQISPGTSFWSAAYRCQMPCHRYCCKQSPLSWLFLYQPFRRRHMSPKGIRPGITWSRRWTVNLVTAEGARRAVAFINQLFLIFNFKNLKFSKISKKKIIYRNCNWKCSKNIPKFEKNEI